MNKVHALIKFNPSLMTHDVETIGANKNYGLQIMVSVENILMLLLPNMIILWP